MERYGKLTIIEIFRKQIDNGGYRTMANCKCDCGNTKIYSLAQLRCGLKKSCGCIVAKHRLRWHPLYNIWHDIKRRCTDPRVKGYKNYGGRGIMMCSEWICNPKEFIVWAIDNGWRKGLTIERTNNNGNYEPSNCIFIPKSMQSKNTRLAKKIEFNGIIDTQSGWADRLNLHQGSISRLMKRGLSFEDSIKRLSQ